MDHKGRPLNRNNTNLGKGAKSEKKSAAPGKGLGDSRDSFDRLVSMQGGKIRRTVSAQLLLGKRSIEVWGKRKTLKGGWLPPLREKVGRKKHHHWQENKKSFWVAKDSLPSNSVGELSLKGKKEERGDQASTGRQTKKEGETVFGDRTSTLGIEKGRLSRGSGYLPEKTTRDGTLTQEKRRFELGGLL